MRTFLPSVRRWTTVLLMALLPAAILLPSATLFPSAVMAFEAADNDAFYLGLGTSNIETNNSDDLLSGSNMLGGIRIGLFWTFFLEIGWGNIAYFDTQNVGGVTEEVLFSTTGPHLGAGLIIPIRAIQLGAKYQRSVNNRWSEERKDQLTGTTISNISGDISFDSYFVFTRMGETGAFEIGARRDLIRDTDSIVANSFGVYIMWNISLKE